MLQSVRLMKRNSFVIRGRSVCVLFYRILCSENCSLLIWKKLFIWNWKKQLVAWVTFIWYFTCQVFYITSDDPPGYGYLVITEITCHVCHITQIKKEVKLLYFVATTTSHTVAQVIII